jgi:hypothetical protein
LSHLVLKEEVSEREGKRRRDEELFPEIQVYY